MTPGNGAMACKSTATILISAFWGSSPLEKGKEEKVG